MYTSDLTYDVHTFGSHADTHFNAGWGDISTPNCNNINVKEIIRLQLLKLLNHNFEDLVERSKYSKQVLGNCSTVLIKDLERKKRSLEVCWFYFLNTNSSKLIWTEHIH